MLLCFAFQAQRKEFPCSGPLQTPLGPISQRTSPAVSYSFSQTPPVTTLHRNRLTMHCVVPEPLLTHDPSRSRCRIDFKLRLQSCCWRFAVPLALRKIQKFHFNFISQSRVTGPFVMPRLHRPGYIGRCDLVRLCQLSVQKRRCASVATVNVCWQGTCNFRVLLQVITY